MPSYKWHYHMDEKISIGGTWKKPRSENRNVNSFEFEAIFLWIEIFRKNKCFQIWWEYTRNGTCVVWRLSVRSVEKTNNEENLTQTHTHTWLVTAAVATIRYMRLFMVFPLFFLWFKRTQNRILAALLRRSTQYISGTALIGKRCRSIKIWREKTSLFRLSRIHRRWMWYCEMAFFRWARLALPVFINVQITTHTSTYAKHPTILGNIFTPDE